MTITKAAEMALAALLYVRTQTRPIYDADQAIEALRAALQDKAGEVRGVPADFVSHRDAWRKALLIAARDAKVDAHEGQDDKAYWRHEIAAFDRAYNELAAQPAPVVPDGFALVPVEPTIGMLIAGMEHRISEEQPTHEHAVWSAMIAASQPSLPTPNQTKPHD